MPNLDFPTEDPGGLSLEDLSSRPAKFRGLRCFLVAAVLSGFGCFLANQCFLPDFSPAYAEDGTPIRSAGEEFFVTIYDNSEVLTVKTAAATVQEILERSAVEYSETDLIEPSLDTVVTETHNINIHHARPAVVIDGVERRYVMTASYDPQQVAQEAGFAIYDGDEIAPEVNQNFLEAGASSTYRITRNGGRSISEEESLPYPTQTEYDYNLKKGDSYLKQAGENGRRLRVYQVNFQDNVEVSRELVSDQTLAEPVPEIVVVGAKSSVSPEQAECAGWAREAGVAEAEIEVALNLIYHESGCRVDSTNQSSGAYGIPQALPGSKMAAYGADWETNPVTQIRWMISYVNGRYGGWQQAMNWWWEHGWY